MLSLCVFIIRPFVDNLAAQFLYFFKACYFIVSSLQIVSGYPVRVIGNFLTSSYNYISCKTSSNECAQMDITQIHNSYYAISIVLVTITMTIAITRIQIFSNFTVTKTILAYYSDNINFERTYKSHQVTNNKALL